MGEFEFFEEKKHFEKFEFRLLKINCYYLSTNNEIYTIMQTFDAEKKVKSAKRIVTKSKIKIQFPTWKSTIIEILDKARKTQSDIFNPEFTKYDYIFSKLDLVHQVIGEKDPIKLMLFLAEADATYSARLDFNTVFEKFKEISVRPNEFYAVFDLYNFRHKEVDPNIEKLLGIKPADFNLPAMAGWDPENPLFHKRDNNHVLRWASIAYFMFTMRLLKWNSMEDQYRVRFRVGTAKSSIKSIKEQEFVALEKLCFLFYDKTDDGSTRPIYHFDKWLVYNQSEFDFVRPMWLSTPERQQYLNDILYLINAYMIAIPTQYLLYLHEKSITDRNKAVANSLNEQILKHSNLNVNFDEQQIADCFAKTIRPKLTGAMNLWDPRELNDLVDVQSDQQAVQYAKVLGLVPIPQNILKSLYSNIVDA